MNTNVTKILSRIIFLLLLAPMLSPAHARDWTQKEKTAALNLAGIAGITAWGIANWNYFENTPRMGHEGWFSKQTPEGGADKCAHFYFSYTLSHALASIYEHWNFSRQGAAKLGALSSFGLMGYMELGDSFSNYGFSHQDFLMNGLGAAAGYLLYTWKGLAEKIDLRLEYIPRFSDADLITDYDHMKFLAAVKLSGFDLTRDTPLGNLELLLGYYAKGYPRHPNKERNIFLGIGISLPRILKTLSMGKTARVFNYYQLPHTYVGLERDLNP